MIQIKFKLKKKKYFLDLSASKHFSRFTLNRAISNCSNRLEVFTQFYYQNYYLIIIIMLKL